MNDKTKTGLNHHNVRTKEQKELMAQIEKDGVCPFCAEYFRKYHPKPILKETDWWFVTENMSPYAGTKMHFLFVYKPTHISSPENINPEGTQDLFTLMNWVIQEYNIGGGAFFMRFGDTSYNGSSVEHLHAQLVVGEKEGDDVEALRVKLGWKKK